MTIDREQLESTIEIISKKLSSENYAFRGTTSLVLQNLDMHVDDIDILCNAETASRSNLKLAEYLVEKVEYKESIKFRSYFGKFLVNGVKVEVMGDWQIFSEKKGWSKIYNADVNNITYVQIEGTKVPVTKVEMELEVFALMGRWNAYQKIKRLSEGARLIDPKSPGQQSMF